MVDKEQIRRKYSKETAKPVVKKKIIRKKKSTADKVVTFFTEDLRTIGDYLVYDILMPAVKDTVFNLITRGVEKTLWGDDTPSHISRHSSSSYVGYSGLNSFIPQDNQPVGRHRTTHQFDSIAFASRRDAEEVLSYLAGLVQDYGVASVADFYAATGTQGDIMDERYGWTNLSRAQINRGPQGWVIALPKTILI